MTQVRRSVRYIREQCSQPRLFLELYWKRICLTAVAGMFAGFTAAAVIDGAFAHPTGQARAHSITLAGRKVGLPAGLSDDDAADLNRLKDRNRRLEALVTVLRQRVEHHRTPGQHE